MARRASTPKIFGIGLNKTGTGTLGVCGKIFGYRCTSWDRGLLKDVVRRNDFTRVKEVIAEHDLFEDWPWPLIYKELDLMCPGSKFILTVRKDGEAWLKSLKQHSLRTNPLKNCRKLAYGYSYVNGHEKEHLELYARHNENIRSYFKGREDDFIEVCWEKGHGWNELCNFLGQDIPEVDFPHSNKASDKHAGKIRVLINRVLSANR